jgi:Rrf2 family transcriptional regulator, iron-sulfur cluster assembly transcription factor
VLRISKKMMFALEAVVDIAVHGGPDPVQSRDITARQGIPQRYLEQVMQRLVRASILRGVRGPRGGYRLARERRRITVGEIARVVYALEADEDLDHLSKSDIGRQVIAPMWRELQDETMARLDAITLEELCQRARACVDTTKPDRMDFNI